MENGQRWPPADNNIRTQREWPVRERVTTGCPDRAHAWLSARFVKHDAYLCTPRPKQFRLDVALTDFGAFRLSRLCYSSPARATVAPSEHLWVIEVVNGWVSHGDAGATGPARLLLHPPNTPLASEWGPDLMVRAVRLPAAGVATALGCDPAEFAVGSVVPVSTCHTRTWLSLSRHAWRQALPHAQPSALLVDATARMLTATVIDTFSIAGPLRRVGSVWGTEAVVIRAKRFIEDNAGRPIGVPEVAAAARVSPTWLSRVFRCHTQMTVMGYVRRVRLDAVHAELTRADPFAGDTVGEIARRWGFAHLGRFAATYQKRYGCAPSDTLRS